MPTLPTRKQSNDYQIWEEKGIAWAMMSVRKRLMSELEIFERLISYIPEFKQGYDVYQGFYPQFERKIWDSFFKNKTIITFLKNN